VNLKQTLWRAVSRVSWGAAIALGIMPVLSGCTTWQPQEIGDVVMIYIELPRLCDRTVQVYSDFAYIRPSRQTVIGNTTCDSEDGMGDADVVWTKTQSPDRWQPPPARHATLRFTQAFGRGVATIGSPGSALTELLAASRKNPNRAIRLTGLADRKEPAKLAERRASAVREWLIANGVRAERVTIGAPAKGGQRVDAEIVARIES